MKTEHKKHLQDVYDINFSIYCLKKDSLLFFVFFFNDCVYKAIACMNYPGKYIIMPSLFIPFDSRIFFSNTFFYLNFLSKIVYRVRRIYTPTLQKLSAFYLGIYNAGFSDPVIIRLVLVYHQQISNNSIVFVHFLTKDIFAHL